MLQWRATVRKGNARGTTGWVTVPKPLVSQFRLGDRLLIQGLSNEEEFFSFIVPIRKTNASMGFYVPSEIIAAFSLIGKELLFQAYKTEYFVSQITQGKRVQIPLEVIEELELKEGSIARVELTLGEKVFSEVIIVSKTPRKGKRDEHHFVVRMNDVPVKRQAKVKIIEKFPIIDPQKPNQETPKNQTMETLLLPSLFPDAVLGKIDENEMIIFLGRHKPIITPISLKISDIAHYFGCYYADGTKKGSGWSINASTPQQAKYYVAMYHSLISSDDLHFELTYTKRAIDATISSDIKNHLLSYWINSSISLSHNNIRILESDLL